MSKVMSLLIEEALRARGLYDGPALTPAPALPETVVNASSEPVRINAREFFAEAKYKNQRDPNSNELSFTERIKQNIANKKLRDQVGLPPEEPEPKPLSDDEEMLRKIKVLQAAGIL